MMKPFAALLGASVSVWLACAPCAVAEEPPIDVAAGVRRSIERVGRELGHSLHSDAHLVAAARALAQNSRNCVSPSRELVEEAMWQNEILEPSHRLMLVRYTTDAPADLLADLPSKLGQLLGKHGQSGSNGGKWTRFGFSALPLEGGESCGVLVILESFVSFAPLKRELPLGQTAQFSARLQPPYHKPRVVFTPPTGDVTPIPLSLEKGALGGAFTCATPGRFLIELLAEDAAGPSVLAKFPIDCGQAPPQLAQLAAQQSAPAPASTAAVVPAQAESQIFDLVNAERQRAGRKPLLRDARLDAVARAYSDEMHQFDFVAHVSPRSGSPSDRVRRAGIATSRLAENLVKAPDARSAHRELMESPGHRASLLDPLAQTMGIGVALTQSPTGEPWVVVTELFAVPMTSN